MIEELSREESSDILQCLREGIPPQKISPIFVKTRAVREVLGKAHEGLRTVKNGAVPAFLIIRATRGAGKTAIIRYLKEELQESVFFVDLEKFYASGEDLFHQFVDGVGRSVIVQAVQGVSSDPITAYKVLSEKGHNGTSIALAGLLEDSLDAWNWLCSGASSLPKLKCGLKLVKNVRDEDALDALATVIGLLARQRPIVLAIDELESTFNELKEKQRAKLRSLLVELINCQKFTKVFFLFAATDRVYEECFKKGGAPTMGLLQRTINITSTLDAPRSEEVAMILERILHLYEHAREFIFSEANLRRIRQESLKSMTSQTPRDIILYALKKGDEKWELSRGYEKIREMLNAASAGILKESDAIGIGKRFEEAVGLLLESVPEKEFLVPQPDVAVEGNWLANLTSGVKGFQKFLDWSVRINSKDLWIEVCITKRENSVIPPKKVIAILAKTLYHDGSAGLFITHNYKRFGIGGDTWGIMTRYPELKKRIAILNLEKEDYRLLMGILGIEKEYRKEASEFLFVKTGLEQRIEELRSEKHFFW